MTVTRQISAREKKCRQSVYRRCLHFFAFMAGISFIYSFAAISWAPGSEHCSAYAPVPA